MDRRCGSLTQRVFGMSLIERHLKAARHQKIEISEVLVDCGSAAETQFVLEPRLKAPVRVVRSTGTCGERVAAAAADETVLATDAATLADARLYGYLGGTAGSKVASGDAADSDAVIARIEPGDVARIDRTATRLSKAVAAVSPLTQTEFRPSSASSGAARPTTSSASRRRNRCARSSAFSSGRITRARPTSSPNTSIRRWSG